MWPFHLARAEVTRGRALTRMYRTRTARRGCSPCSTSTCTSLAAVLPATRGLLLNCTSPTRLGGPSTRRPASPTRLRSLCRPAGCKGVNAVGIRGRLLPRALETRLPQRRRPRMVAILTQRARLPAQRRPAKLRIHNWVHGMCSRTTRWRTSWQSHPQRVATRTTLSVIPHASTAGSTTTSRKPGEAGISTSSLSNATCGCREMWPAL